MEKKILDILEKQEATWVIAHKLGMRGHTSKVLKIMKRLESEGLVKRHPYDSIKNSIVWVKV